METGQVVVSVVFAALVVPFFAFIFWTASHLKVE